MGPGEQVNGGQRQLQLGARVGPLAEDDESETWPGSVHVERAVLLG
ncbi:hypothetical protein [Streptomyces sp. NRRL S-448]